MSNTEFNPGDVVMLKSGGLKMTVESSTEVDRLSVVAKDSSRVWCVWFVNTGGDNWVGPERATFDSAVLMKVEPE
jgi:uncharacterized protein YodC (DUF2158 family)